jgi:hypothetical protein
VVSVTKKYVTLERRGIEGPVYAVKAKMYRPPSKYSNDLFRVRVYEPMDLAKNAPAVMEHGFFTFDSYRKLEVGKLLGIIISSA